MLRNTWECWAETSERPPAHSFLKNHLYCNPQQSSVIPPWLYLVLPWWNTESSWAGQLVKLTVSSEATFITTLHSGSNIQKLCWWWWHCWCWLLMRLKAIHQVSGASRELFHLFFRGRDAELHTHVPPSWIITMVMRIQLTIGGDTSVLVVTMDY